MQNALKRAPRRLAQVLAAVSCVLLAACTPREAAPLTATSPWLFYDNRDHLRIASCPDGVAHTDATPVALDAKSVALSHIDPATDLPRATFIGAWHLTSPDPAFGGLSGLVVEPEGDLLAISDQGAFVWIELREEVPVAARMASMRDDSGDVMVRKQWRDAEGLELREGIALVSFEREHRVLAFDLVGCGAAARGVDVARLGDRIAGMRDALPANAGAEGLVLTAQGELLLAIEAVDSGLPLAQVNSHGGAGVVGRLARRDEPVLTGIGRSGDTLYALLRSYVPMIGNTIEVVALPLPDGESLLPAKRILRLQPRHGTDNFEGIALAERSDGGLRMWLVSDDNFSRAQRTLLYAFDLRSPGSAQAP